MGYSWVVFLGKVRVVEIDWLLGCAVVLFCLRMLLGQIVVGVRGLDAWVESWLWLMAWRIVIRELVVHAWLHLRVELPGVVRIRIIQECFSVLVWIDRLVGVHFRVVHRSIVGWWRGHSRSILEFGGICVGRNHLRVRVG